jgi:hypothetical protein
MLAVSAGQLICPPPTASAVSFTMPGLREVATGRASRCRPAGFRASARSFWNRSGAPWARLVEGFGDVVDAVEDHGNERKRLPSVVAVSEGLRQQPLAEAAALLAGITAQPGQHCYGERPAW